jgi:DNA-binding response OmpR family regulator
MTELPTAIVVDADVAELRRTTQALEEAGFIVMTANSFPKAKALLESVTPEIVIAEIKLEAFNGLHLAALCAASRPGTPFVITHHVYDAVFDADAQRLGAAFIVKTATREELTRAAGSLFESRRHGLDLVRRSYRKPAPVQTVVQVAASRAEVVDVSYGGVRLKVPVRDRARAENELPSRFVVEFPNLDLSLLASRVWWTPDQDTGRWLCGADVSRSDSDQLERWREFVDSLA